MNATAAVLYEVKKPVVVEDVELLEPGAHEVLVKWTANGVCHSPPTTGERGVGAQRRPSQSVGSSSGPHCRPPHRAADRTNYGVCAERRRERKRRKSRPSRNRRRPMAGSRIISLAIVMILRGRK
jgi:hypothetical protein